ncbi:hypothetical protein C369_04231 [Cryptococcus neoformans A5-35-17]|nr:hypothetical protein C369_04231 [Cryptococcus neoformans var. grubii A5-35-17]
MLSACPCVLALFLQDKILIPYQMVRFVRQGRSSCGYMHVL